MDVFDTLSLLQLKNSVICPTRLTATALATTLLDVIMFTSTHVHSEAQCIDTNGLSDHHLVYIVDQKGEYYYSSIFAS